MFKGFVVNGQFYNVSTRGRPYPGTGVRVTTYKDPQNAAQFVADSFGRDQNLIAREDGLSDVPLIEDGKLTPGALEYLWPLLSDEEIRLLALFGVTRETIQREDT